MVTGIIFVCLFFFLQAEDGIRDLVRSRGLGDVYKRQDPVSVSLKLLIFWFSTGLKLPTDTYCRAVGSHPREYCKPAIESKLKAVMSMVCLLYTSDAADERSSVDLGGRRIINKKTKKKNNIARSQYAS